MRTLTEAQLLFAVGAELVSLHKTEEFKAGNYAISGRLELAFQGAVLREPDQLVSPDLRIGLPELMALLSEELKIRPDTLYKVLIKAAVAAYKNKVPVGEFLDLSTKALRDAKAVILKNLKRAPKKGALKRSITIEVAGISGVGLKLAKQRSG